MPLLIEDNFLGCAPGGSRVSVRIVGPDILQALRSGHAGVRPGTFFSHDGSTLSFAMGRRGAQLAENFRPVLGEPTSVIEHAIAQAAASYFADIEAAARPEPPRASSGLTTSPQRISAPNPLSPLMISITLS